MGLKFKSEDNLFDVLESGQMFFAEDFGHNKKLIVYSDTIIKIVKIRDGFVADIAYSETERDENEFLSEFFDNDKERKAKISEAYHLIGGAGINIENKKSHMRILKQPFYETLFAFILSANKNIPAIRKSVKAFREIFPTREAIVDGEKIKLFPNPDTVARNKNLIPQTSIGFRAKYIEKLVSDEDILKNPPRSSDKEAEVRNALKSLYGVGDKIADCAMIYSLGFYNLIPGDVWIKRILKKLFNFEMKNYDDYRSWVADKFGDSASLIGQVFFEERLKILDE